MLTAVTTAITTVIGWVGTVISSLLTGGALTQLLPLFAIGIAISAVLLGKLVAEVKTLKVGETLLDQETIPSQAAYC